MIRNGKKNEFYDELVESMTQALAFTRGDQAKGRLTYYCSKPLPEYDAQQSKAFSHGEAGTEELVTICNQLKYNHLS